MNILVTGANGQLGSQIKYIEKNYKKYFFLFKDYDSLDITDESQLNEFFEKNNVDLLINCAAYTNVDSAEIEREICNQINNLSLEIICKACVKYEIKLIHISTDFVFGGNHNFKVDEKAKPNPENYYGLSKYNGEKIILKYNLKNSIIIRTSWLFSKFKKNFFTTVRNNLLNNIKMKVVDDQYGCPTYAADLAKCLLDIVSKIENTKPEIYHYCNEGSCSWFDFAVKIQELLGYSEHITSISSDKYSQIAKRPSKVVFDTSKIKNNFNLPIPTWEKSLKKLINNL